VWRWLRPYRGRIVAALLLLGVSVPLSQVHPLVWRFVVDNLLSHPDPRALLGAIGIMLGAQLLASATGALHGYLLGKAGQGLVRDVRSALFERLEHQSLGWHHDRRAGDLATRVISDVDAMESSVLRDLSDLIEEALTFVIVAGIVIALQPVVGLATMLPLFLSFGVIHVFRVRVSRLYEGVRARLGDLGAYVQERLGAVQLTQSFGRERVESARFAELSADYFRRSVRVLRVRSLFFPGVGFLGFLSNAFMLGLGAWFIWQGEFTIGGLIAYRGYWWRLQSPIHTLARAADTLMRARASALRVFGVLAEPVRITDPPSPAEWTEPAGAIEFRGVVFGYAPERPVLRGISFRVAPGEFVAVAGTSGAGKSTLLALIPRFFDAQEGAVLVDGRDVRAYGLHALRGGIAMVLQEASLFNESILDNIRYARPDASVEEVEQAARRANAHGFIAALPGGYGTVIGERGVKLSGGQRQRISVARAFLADPTILLLDEPTSSVEPESEDLIHASLLELSRERTTLLVTHRITLLERARRILFLEHGTIAADGSHAELLERSPAYAAAYDRWSFEERVRAARQEVPAS
jgi:ATP-binding cassette subfamily B protein